VCAVKIRQLVAGDDVKQRIVYLLVKGKIAWLRTMGHGEGPQEPLPCIVVRP